MHVILPTIGTDGDVFPHIGLGVALRGRGHLVTLAAPEPFRSRATSFDLGFEPLVTAEEYERLLADPNFWHPFKSGVVTARWGAPMIPRQYEALARLAAQPDSVLVANSGVLAARLVQEKLGTPTATLLLQPGLVQSNVEPPKLPGGLTIPKWLPLPLRRLGWMGLDAVGYALLTPTLNRVRAGLGLVPVRRVFRWWLSPELVIGLFPPWYAAPQPDWPPQLRLAGFGRFDGSPAALPEDVRSFCDDGPPPIAFTLGTGMKHATDFFRTAVAACDVLGQRGLLLTKYADMIPSALPPRVCHCSFAPFRQLLPRCAAVVHHGGIGTTAAALEAGCPQIILPLAWDQPDNANRIAKLGVGCALGPRSRTGKGLSDALAKVMTPDVGERCRLIAQKAVLQDGLQLAAQWVEELAVMSRAARA
jgi:rhamnosyltransferase subunit B